MEIKIKEIEALKVESEDIVKIRLEEDITEIKCQQFREYLRGIFPDNKVIILMPGCDLEIEKGNGGVKKNGQIN